MDDKQFDLLYCEIKECRSDINKLKESLSNVKIDVAVNKTKIGAFVSIISTVISIVVTLVVKKWMI